MSLTEGPPALESMPCKEPACGLSPFDTAFAPTYRTLLHRVRQLGTSGPLSRLPTGAITWRPPRPELVIARKNGAAARSPLPKKPNYQFEKRKKELERQKRKEAKKQKSVTDPATKPSDEVAEEKP